MSIRRFVWLMIITISITGVVSAQSDVCEMMLDAVLEAVGDACDESGINQICYGNNTLSATDFAGAAIADFSVAGDIADIEMIASIETAGFDGENDIWGIGILSLQADLPDTVAGQHVTFVIFGDTQLINDVMPDDSSAPMQAFSLSTGLGETGCEDVPPGGVLIQTPADTTVHFMVNGVEIELGSTVFIRIFEGRLEITTIEGTVTVTSGDVSQVIEPGMTVYISVDGEPGAPVPFNYDDFASLPVILLPEPTGIPLLVRSDNEWRGSGIFVNAGDTFTLHTGGVINFWDNCETEKVANGQPDIDCDSLVLDPDGGDPVTLSGAVLGSDMSMFPVPAAPPHSLVARIGSSTFFVGNGGDFTATESGILEFRANDIDLNNLGAFFVRVILP